MTTTLTAPGQRSAGVLLHPTSLPSPYGIGDLGPVAYAWVDALVRAEQSWWQTLPLGPTGYGDSPYQSLSSFAGNPNLISPDLLLQDGLLKRDDLTGARFPAGQVDYGSVITYKTRLLEMAWQNFRRSAAPALRAELDAFVTQQADWLEDYVLFMALKERYRGMSWQEWPRGLIKRDPDALTQARRAQPETLNQHRFRQFLFFRQWSKLKDYANRQGLRLIGDVPIFVASDSSDLWANPDQFLLNADNQPEVVAGVPPDYFSPTGQRWGNPLYDWEAQKKTGYAWWIKRLKATLAHVDLVRLDHFRGFHDAWHIPADAPTAEMGQWVPGPGAVFFRAMEKALGGLPLVAEDLGDITPGVRALRDEFQLPGMRVLQFAWDNHPDNPFLPHNYMTNTVVYTGTHDNDTTRGWYSNLPYHDKQFLWRYLNKPPIDDHDISWELVRMAWGSVADLALVPLQDLLNLDSHARMNLPGRQEGNWQWRVTTDQPVEQALQALRDLTWLYNRRPQR
jgi:4-alpha-glucanotransferase